MSLTDNADLSIKNSFNKRMSSEPTDIRLNILMSISLKNWLTLVEIARLNELFATTGQLPQLQQSDGGWTAQWEDAGLGYHIFFYPQTNAPEGVWDVAFAPLDKPSKEFDYTTDMMKRKKTSAAVMGQVVSYIRSFMQGVKPLGLFFAGLESKRQKLYTRMIQALSQEYKSAGYVFLQPNTETFGLVRRNTRYYLQLMSAPARAKMASVAASKRDAYDRFITRT